MSKCDYSDWRLQKLDSNGLEAHHDWFGLQADAPNFFHAMLDLFLQGEDIGGCGCAAIDDRQRVAGGNADTAEAESFGESRALDQPGCRNFLAGFECGIAGQG